MSRQGDIDRTQRAQRDDQKRVDEAARLEQERDDTQWLMSTAQGRRIVWTELGEAGVFRTSFTGNSETFFKEGQRNIGLLKLNRVMLHAPNQFLTMMAENK